MYTIKTQLSVDGRTYLAGIGVGVENNDGIVESQVLLAASRVAIIDPNTGSSSAVAPFVVQGGQVFINSAVIGTASISFAKISDTVQSDNFVPNISGWKLSKAGGLQINGSTADGGRMQIVNDALRLYYPNGQIGLEMGLFL